MKPCLCCQNQKPAMITGHEGYGYNRLEGEVREWAKDNGLTLSEYCVRVTGGKRLSGPNWIKNKCGDGRMGFSTRRKAQDKVRMERGLDGQLKRKRSTLVNKRSARSVSSRRSRRVDGSKINLISSIQIIEAMRDPIIVAQQKKLYTKSNRAQNRNNGARRGHKRSMTMMVQTRSL